MIKNLRVGIPVIGGKGWLGGASHMELHVKAVTTLPKEERPQLFLVIPEDTIDGFDYYRSFLSCFDGIIFAGDQMLAPADAGLPLIYCNSWDEVFSHIDFFFPVSFNVFPGRPAASWVHDFQHKHLPEFFSPQDIALRDSLCRRIAEHSRLVFCSSKAVEQDFRHFYPHSQAVTRVLALRVVPEDAWYDGDPAAVQQQYHLPDRFILCSNQFWIHKNHQLLFKALSILRQTEQDIHLVCTGLTSDFRCPSYMDELGQYINELGIGDLVHILGQIPRHDQIQLIRRSLFVVQPSLFEGLSLIVQECRALGKLIVLSDLDVHLEHEYGISFKRSDAGDLAAKISALLPITQPGPNSEQERLAKLQSVSATTRYAKEFCRLVEESQQLFPTKSATKTAPATMKSPIVTSLIPADDITSQRQAVDSWLRAGFSAMSLNRSEDIAILKNDFPDVAFIAADKIKQDSYGKYHVYFDDLLACLEQSGSAVGGIVEPDICLYGQDLANHIAHEAANCIVYQEKINVEALQVFEGRLFPEIGVVFLDCQFAQCYPKSDFCLGMPWWDYWALLLSVIGKIPVKKLTTPFAYHVIHSEQYDVKAMLSLSEVLTNYAPPPFPLSINTLPNYQHILSQIISNHSLTLALYGLTVHKDNN